MKKLSFLLMAAIMILACACKKESQAEKEQEPRDAKTLIEEIGKIGPKISVDNPADADLKAASDLFFECLTALEKGIKDKDQEKNLSLYTCVLFSTLSYQESKMSKETRDSFNDRGRNLNDKQNKILEDLQKLPYANQEDLTPDTDAATIDDVLGETQNKLENVIDESEPDSDIDL